MLDIHGINMKRNFQGYIYSLCTLAVVSSALKRFKEETPPVFYRMLLISAPLTLCVGLSHRRVSIDTFHKK